MMQATALQTVFLLQLFVHFPNILAYSQVQISGSAANKDDGPKVYKALNMDLIYPKTFNATAYSDMGEIPMDQITTTAAPLPEYNQNQQNTKAPPILFVTPPEQSQMLENSEQTTEAPQNMANVNIEQLQQKQQHVMFMQQQQSNQQQQQFASFQQQQHLAAPQRPQQQPTQAYEMNENMYASTGRAVDHRSSYQNFGQLLTPLMKNTAPARAYNRMSSSNRMGSRYNERTRPVYDHRINSGRYYPQNYQQSVPSRAELNKIYGNGLISDRFTPGEAVATAQFGKKYKQKYKQQQQQQQQLRPLKLKSTGPKIAASSNVVQSYVPPKDLYSFPPNLNAKYPSPAEDPKAAVPTSSVSSYLPAPSGPISNAAGYPVAAASSNSEGYKYEGPISPDYLPPSNGDAGKEDDKNTADGDGDGDTDDIGNDNTVGVLPASAMDAGKANGADDMDAMAVGMSDMDMDHDHGHDHDHAHDHDHDHALTGYDTDKEYPTPPPGWLEDHPESAHDHPPHDHFPSYFDHHHPEIIYDDDHHHHHQNHPEPPPPPPPVVPETTPVAPPPEPPPEPRVKKYSYFYIGRKLWYIPLYFTVWFSFYVLWLIVKSIARHKVNLPNHYTSRRSLPDFMGPESNREEYLNQLTVNVLNKIEDFKRKYLT